MTGTFLLDTAPPDGSGEADSVSSAAVKPAEATSQVGKLYADLFSRPVPATAPATPSSNIASGNNVAARPAGPSTASAPAAPTLLAPRPPTSLAESGLQLGQIADLVLKQLYLHGTL